MGNPAPFHARSRLRRSGATRLSSAHQQSLQSWLRCNHATPSASHNAGTGSANSNHRNCPCCNSTLSRDRDIHRVVDPLLSYDDANRSRYAPYIMSTAATRRSFRRRQHLQQLQQQLQQQQQDVHQYDNDNMHNDMDPADHDGLAFTDNAYVGNETLPLDTDDEDGQDDLQADDGDDDSDQDAIPYPYASSRIILAPFANTTTTISPSAPPIPRLPPTSDLERLNRMLPGPYALPDLTSDSRALQLPPPAATSPRRPRVWPTSSLLDQFSEDDTPDPWMYGTLPRRAEVTVPRRVTTARPQQVDDATDNQDDNVLVTPSSGVTAAGASSNMQPRPVRQEVDEEDPDRARQESLVGNVLRNVYTTLTSLLGGGGGSAHSTSLQPSTRPSATASGTLPPTSSPPSSATTVIPWPNPPTSPSFTSTLADPTGLVSISVSSTTPVTTRRSRSRSRPRSPASSSPSSTRPTGLALAPTLSARMRGTLANAAQQAALVTATDTLDNGLTSPTTALREATAWGNQQPWTPHGPSYLSGDTTALQEAAESRSRNRPWALHDPTYFSDNTARASASGAATASGMSSAGMELLRAMGAAGAGSAGGRGGRLVFPPTPREFYASVGTAAAPAASMGEDSASASSMRMRAERPRAGLVLGVAGGPVHAGEGTGGQEGQEQGAQARLGDEIEDTYIPGHLFVGRGNTRTGVAQGQGQRASANARDGDEDLDDDDDDDDDDELGPMDDSWEMVVRPFDSYRGPSTPYDYHEHMF